jgi:hypothetical protein
MRTIHFGSEDSVPVLFTCREAWGYYKGWREWSVTDCVCKAASLTEAAYRERFGDLPPLPDHAFGGWRSPLV